MELARTAPSRGFERALLHLQRNPALLAWCFFILLSPIHLVRNGMPQPGDLIVLIVAPLALARWDGRIDRDSLGVLRVLAMFAAWTFLVNYGWAVVLGRFDRWKDFLIHPFFYWFNVLVFFTALVVARRGREAFIRLTVDVVYVSVVLLVMLSFVYRTKMNRGVLVFNTPNQLGYYATLAACLFGMTQRLLRRGRFRSGFGVTCCAYLATLSGSRAALAGIAVLLFVILFSNPKTVIVATLAALALMTLGGPLKHAIDNAEQRATWLARHGTFAEERGYDRLWKFPEYLITGAGEGEYARFVPAGEHGRELHSSFGTVVFGYGVLGTTLCLVFFARLFRGASRRNMLMMIPALTFTIAHQGLRFTMFWIVLAVFQLLKDLPTDPPGSRVAGNERLRAPTSSDSVPPSPEGA